MIAQIGTESLSIADRWLAFMGKQSHLLIVLMAIGYYLLYFNYGLDLDDEGFLLLNAEGILHGKWPVADGYTYPPFSYFLLAGFFQLFGNNVLTERILLLVLLVICIAVLIYTGKKISKGAFYLIPVIFYAAAPGPWYKVFFVFHLLLIFGAAVWYVEGPSWQRAAVIGLAIGIALISRFEAGMVGFVGSIGALVAIALFDKGHGASGMKRGLRDFGSLACGITVILAFTAVAYVLVGKAGLAWERIHQYYAVGESVKYVNALTGREDQFNPSELLREPQLTQWVYALSLCICAINVIRGLWHLWTDDVARRGALILLLGVFGIGSMGYTYFYVWNSRILSSFAIVYLNWGSLLLALRTPYGRWFQRLLVILVCAFALTTVIRFARVQNYSGSITTIYPGHMVKVDHPKLEGIRVYDDQVEDIQALMREVAKRDDPTLVPMSEATTMAYLAGAQNPTFYRLFTAEFAPPGEIERAIREFDRQQIDFFVARRSQFLQGGGPSSDLAQYAPLIKKYLVSKYRIRPLGMRFVILARDPMSSTQGD